MKYIIIGVVLTFGLLFTVSSGILKGEAFAIPEERNGYDQYDKDPFYGIDKELLDNVGNKLFEGIDKDRLVNNALNLLSEYGIDIGVLEEQLLQEEWGGSGYAGGFVLILVLFILLVIIGAGFGLGYGG